MEKHRENLDRIFDLVLLLATIISATLFQYISSIPYSQEEVTLYELRLRVSLRLFLIPILLTMGMWIPTQITRQQTPRVLMLKICTWTYLLAMLIFYIVFVIALGFALTITWLTYAVIMVVITVPIIVFLVYFVMVEYERATYLKEFRRVTRSLLRRQGQYGVILGLVFMGLSIFFVFLEFFV